MPSKQCKLNTLSRLDFNPEIDLFVSRLNRQFDKYCSLRPDPDAFVIDAFKFPCNAEKFYFFLTLIAFWVFFKKKLIGQCNGDTCSSELGLILLKMLCTAPILQIPSMPTSSTLKQSTN